MFQYRQRYQEGYNCFSPSLGLESAWRFQYRQRYQEGYNFAAISSIIVVPTRFQYRQRYQEGYNRYGIHWMFVFFGGFNTDNGIRRATIGFCVLERAVLGTFQYRQRYQEGYNHRKYRSTVVSRQHVSIPTTVSGGLQYEPEESGKI